MQTLSSLRVEGGLLITPLLKSIATSLGNTQVFLILVILLVLGKLSQWCVFGDKQDSCSRPNRLKHQAQYGEDVKQIDLRTIDYTTSTTSEKISSLAPDPIDLEKGTPENCEKMWHEGGFQATDPSGLADMYGFDKLAIKSETRRNTKATKRAHTVMDGKTTSNQEMSITKIQSYSSIETSPPESPGVSYADVVPIATFGDRKGKRPADAHPIPQSPRKRRPSSARIKPRKSSGDGLQGNGETGDGREDEEDDGGGDDSDEPGDDPSPIRFWACPFYKWKPYKYYRCHAKYEFRRPGDVKLHMIRCHSLQQYYCQICWKQWGDNDVQSWENHHQIRQCVHMPKPDELDRVEVALLKTIPRGLKDQQKWYWLWDNFFAEHQSPDSPFVEEGIGEPTTVINRDIHLALRRGLPALLQDVIPTSMGSAQAEAIVDQIFSLVSSAPQNESQAPRVWPTVESAHGGQSITNSTVHVDADFRSRTMPKVESTPGYLAYHMQDQNSYDQDADSSDQQQYLHAPQVTINAPTEQSEVYSDYAFSNTGSYGDVGRPSFLDAYEFEGVKEETSPVSIHETFVPDESGIFETAVGSDFEDSFGSHVQNRDYLCPPGHGESTQEPWENETMMISGCNGGCGNSEFCECRYRY